ncbi:MAG TPA: CRISPR-associated helicase Cas3', partial [Clostridiales bacterium]|nr:CRISPR-associated helicase Cas3' [Clostridiales bacterium]
MYYAHISDDGRKQTITEHLDNVSTMSEEFSAQIFKEIASVVGKTHDIGKYAVNFQKRLDGSNAKFEHSVCGAIEFNKLLDKKNPFIPLIQYCVAGHHTGLPDGRCVCASENDSSLFGKLKREKNYNGDNDYSAYKDEIELSLPKAPELIEILSEAFKISNQEFIEVYSFFTRYVFSCLKDADCIDTERFCNPEAERGLIGDFKAALDILNEKLNSFSADTPVRAARKSLQQQAFSSYADSENISILNMPTGSGKTLCSLKLALEKAVSSGKKRIIYVIPYTSIIEQTANELNQMFGDILPVLQHHSNYSFDKDESELLTAEKLKKTTENWDAPLIVTTSVQFFQSLYHHKGSRLRKLHNLSDAVIIFDEIHLIPIEYIQPCLRAIGYITKFLNSNVIFLSATMPNYDSLIKEFMPFSKVTELITDKSDFARFKNCTYENMGVTQLEDVVLKTDEFESSLIIVNKKRTARTVYNILQGKRFHLSAYMTPFHRSKIIKIIRECLNNHKKITVVSTSLIEAGVDVDFEVVFRELTGLDSILQSGGRCNREGNRKNGYVYVFETDEKPQKEIAVRCNITSSLLNDFPDISSDECISEYFKRIFDFKESYINENSIYRYNNETKQFTTENKSVDIIPFKSYAENFDYIKSETISIVIDNEQNGGCHELVLKLKNGDKSVRRQLQKYCVSVYFYEFENLLKLGIINDYGTGV